jgi:[CysO sulfur-carrier protein]-S-L-cysteine hydrolase
MTDHGQYDVVIPTAVVDAMVAHCLLALPYEGCGLIVGDPRTNTVDRAVGTANEARSSRLFAVGSRDLLRVDREAERDGLAILGVFHSHTHTDPYPSPTDIAQAPDPAWHYVLVSLRDEVASVRSYRITKGVVTEEAIVSEPSEGDPRSRIESPGQPAGNL